MKKLMYLLVGGTMFIFTACNSGSGDAAANDSVEEVAACADDCLKACCLGCKATIGDVVCLANHSCCGANEDEVTEEVDAHEGHDHESHEGHDHESHEGHEHE
ncbi:hypothetical protein OAJ65_00870 [Flavobacteriales bacterium]|nr:hypothetical protein [Flavobacteriales bacterium]